MNSFDLPGTARTERPLRGVRVLQLELGDILNVGGQPHTIVKRLGGGKLLVRPVRELVGEVAAEDRGRRTEDGMGLTRDGGGNGNGEIQAAGGRDAKSYRRELMGDRCWCGEGKFRGKPFCLLCWKRLPARMQSGMHARMGLGYEEAFEAARTWLERERARDIKRGRE